MLKKFIDDECKGYIIDFRYDGVRHMVIVRATKEDVSVSKSTHGDVLIVNPLFIIDCVNESFPFDSESVISIFKDVGIF